MPPLSKATGPGCPTPSTCLAGIRILCGANTPEEVSVLCTRAKELGGVPATVKDLKDDSPPKVLVSMSVQTPEYAAAREEYPDISRVAPSWLEACKALREKAPYEGHLLKPFSGLMVSLSGGGKDSSRMKAAYRASVVQHGGIYSPELSCQCTHLVIIKQPIQPQEVSAKESYARRVNTINIVWDAWIADNADAGVYKGNETSYAVPAMDEAAGRKPAPSHVLRANSMNSMASESAGPKKEAGGLRKAKRKSPESSSEVSLPTIGTRVGQPREEGGPGTTAGPGPDNGAVEAQAAAAPADVLPQKPVNAEDAAIGAAVQRPVQPQCRTSTDTTGPTAAERSLSGLAQEEDTLFLSGALVHLACCSPQEQLEMLRILREGGCTRRPDLRNDVTHVVLGSDQTLAELKAVEEHGKKYDHCSVVSRPDWLRECLRDRQLLPVSQELTVSAQDLAQMVSQQAAAAQAAAVAPAPQVSDSEPMERSNLPEPSSRVLEGYAFTLTALAGDREEKAYRRVIWQARGRCFDRHTIALVNTRERAYALCPVSLTIAAKDRLKEQHPDMALVPDQNWVTLRWLDISLNAGNPLVPIPEDRVECQPLPYQVPLPCMADIVVSVSSMSEQQKMSIKALVVLLGGRYTVKMGDFNTHLIVPFATGVKFDAAPARGVTPVTHHWLIALAKQGKLPRERDFYPPKLGLNDHPMVSQASFDVLAPPAQSQPAQPSQAAGKHGSFMQRVLAGQPSQATAAAQGKKPWRGLPPKPAAKKPAAAAKRGPAARSSQGLSTLDTLSQQLRSPAAKKARQTMAAAHMDRAAQQAVAAAAPEPLPALQAAVQKAAAGAQSLIPATELLAAPRAGTGTSPAAQPQEVAAAAEDGPAQKRGGAAGEQELVTGSGGADGAVDDGGEAEEGGDPEAGDPAELSAHLERLTGLLAARADQVQLQDFSQQELMEPPPHNGQATRRESSTESDPLAHSAPLLRRSTRGSGSSSTSQDATAGNKRARAAAAGKGAAKGSSGSGAAQVDCSQQVGYEAPKWTNGPTRMAKSAQAALRGPAADPQLRATGAPRVPLDDFDMGLPD